MALKIVTLALLSAFVIVLTSGEKYNVDQVCLGCICQAASGCNVTQGCIGDICGPFHITWGYWADSGKPTLNGQPATDKDAYANCANDAQCAARAVQGYMDVYGQDCNKDGKINCDDFARIHYLGGYGCSGTLPPKYEKEYNECRSKFSA
ncbi:lysozyme 3-like [Copidosoma floridanum]|uniref:lysozyme 3-like n=1 Tax=Copidosoma floridanum TaxID=29053 RepID=UPI0006C97C73|nr:lysozyme 3-like [Copidosoma floridanum]